MNLLQINCNTEHIDFCPVQRVIKIIFYLFVSVSICLQMISNGPRLQPTGCGTVPVMRYSRPPFTLCLL